MDTNRSQFIVNEGDEVFGSDGDKVGKVIAVQNDYVVVEKGWFFPTDYYVPASAIASYDGGQIFLNVTKDAALEQGWDTVPVLPNDYDTTRVATGYDATALPDESGTLTDTGYVPPKTPAATTAAAPLDTELTDRVADDTLHVPVYEEELTATTTAREMGGVRIEKDVVTEEQGLDVPVTEERLKVVRRTVDREVDAAADGTAFEEVIVDVPVRVEDVEVAKRVRVAEEIDVEKEAVQRTKHVSDSVRREEVRVTEGMDNTVVDDRTANQ